MDSGPGEQLFKGHILVADSSQWTTECHHCQKLILGLLKPGLKCHKCNKIFHKECCPIIRECQHPLGRTASLEQQEQHHTFKLQQYYKPTDCDFCNCLLLGVIRQGLQCTKCSFNVHEKCKDKVAQRCQKTAATNYASHHENAADCSPTPSLPMESSDPEKENRRSVQVFRGSGLFDSLLGLRNKDGCPTILKEDWLLHSKVCDTADIEQNFWRLDSRSIQLYKTKPIEVDRISAPAEKIILLSEIDSIESLSNIKFNFVIRTKDRASFYVLVPNLDRYKSEFGINLTSAWETNIRMAMIAYNEDQKNQFPDIVPTASQMDPPKSPRPLSSSGRLTCQTTLTSTVKYNIVSDNVLGSGQFGTVYEAIEQETGKSVAVKIIDKTRFSVPMDKKSTLMNEVNILRDLSHPGVVKLLNVFQNGEIVCVVMEKMNGGDLLDYVLTRPEKTISERQTRFFAFQILTAIKYLHKRDVVHCDLKPENILLLTSTADPARFHDPKDPTFYPHQVKLCDFGFSRIIGESSFRNSLVGTPAYLAPEVMSDQPVYNRSLDLWSVGVCLYVCLTSFFPFDSPMDIIETSANMSRLFPIEMWHHYSYSCVNLIQQLLQTNYESRPKVERALKHVWFGPPQCYQDLQQLEELTGIQWLTRDYIL